MNYVGAVWLIVVLGAILGLVITLVWLGFQAHSMYKAARQIDFSAASDSASATDFSDLEKSAAAITRLPAPTGDQRTLSQARITHKRIRLIRAVQRQQRLRRAKQRWTEYGLLSPQSGE